MFAHSNKLFKRLVITSLEGAPPARSQSNGHVPFVFVRAASDHYPSMTSGVEHELQIGVNKAESIHSGGERAYTVRVTYVNRQALRNSIVCDTYTLCE